MLKADAVFEGGGVKGIGLVGAVCYLEEQGYTWGRVAGTSAGSIIAALLAVGYTGKELKKIVGELNYKEFLSKDRLQSIPILGKPLGFFIEKGIYNGNNIEAWMGKNLKAKGKTKFKDVSINGKSTLKIIATDITKKDILILPDDLVKYNIDPMEFEIAKAVRMSISIPFYFKPVALKTENGMNFIVDGGVLSNFPIWVFDAPGVPRWPTFGFKFLNSEVSRSEGGKKDILSFTMDLVNTMLEENEMKHIKETDFIRTVVVPPMGVKATEFDITKEKCKMLFDAGYEAGEIFLKKWDFQRYVQVYRGVKKSSNEFFI